MPHKNEQLRIQLLQDILFYTYLKTIDMGNALEVWIERRLTIPIINNIYRINLHELLH